MNIRFFNAKILVTNQDHSFDIQEGELWVKGNTIFYIGDGENIGKVINDNQILLWDREIDVKGNLLMPGFKNAHTHTTMTFLRSYADDLPLWDWLNNQVFPKEKMLTAEDVYYTNVLGIMEYLTSGITSDFDMYFFQEVTAKAANDCGFRMVQTSPLNDFTSSIEEQEELYYKFQEEYNLVKLIPGFHAEYTTSLPLMEKLSGLSHKLKTPIWTHNSETQKEVNECIGRHGMTPTQIMDKLGLFDYGGGGYHCVWFDDKDYEIFKNKNLSVITNPSSNLKLASGIAPIKRFYDEGINLGIGTDGPASNNCLDMFREMFLTSALAKVKEMDAECISADEIVYMATAGGARAMSMEECDSLAVGKRADIIMIDLKKPNMQPINNIVKNLVYSGSKQNVAMTMIDGKILYENGNYLIGISEDEVYERVNATIERMK